MNRVDAQTTKSFHLLYIIFHHPSTYTQIMDAQIEWQIGVTTFESFDDAKLQICTKSHMVRGNLATIRRNLRCLHLACKERGCPFEAYVSYNKKDGSYVL
jgi:hypothetical protein